MATVTAAPTRREEKSGARADSRDGRLEKPSIEDVLSAFSARLTPKVRESYLGDLRVFARWRGKATPAEALGELMMRPGLEVDAVVAEFLKAQEAVGIGANSRKRRLSALRAVFNIGRSMGLTTVALTVRATAAQNPDRRDDGPATGFEDLLRTFLCRRGPVTSEFCKTDLRMFTKWLGAARAVDAVQVLMTRPGPEVDATIQAFLAAERAAGRAASTCKRRLSTFRTLFRVARNMGFTSTILHGRSDGATAAPAAPAAGELERVEALALMPARPETRGVEGLLRAFLGRRKANTSKNYASDLKAVAAWMAAPSVGEAVRRLMGMTGPEANGTVYDFLQSMRGQGKAPSSCNRRLATFRALFKIGRLLGVTVTTIDVDREKLDPYPADTQGPGIERIVAMFADLDRRSTDRTAGAVEGHESAVRDRAIVRMLFNQGLRINEVLSLDLAHVDEAAGRVSILGKARTKREPITLSAKTRAALQEWLAVRGREPGALFCSCEKYGDLKPGRRLQRENFWRNLHKRYAVKPHGLRHAAITAALVATNGDIAKVRLFSRHTSLDVIRFYDDRRRDAAGEIAGVLDGLA